MNLLRVKSPNIYNEYNKIRTRSITELLRSRPTLGTLDPNEELDLLYF